ncbi:uncharacterized protein LOC130721649 [Lotus japonicus]|uniref:uncharacterized protein LOC130721649 n=1 Tax=Lotus japonicus TaxID=34305 RepID=UPI00258C5294|nr:uncharacterized protein LOC130721649 [Lotus japonicus]
MIDSDEEDFDGEVLIKKFASKKATVSARKTVVDEKKMKKVGSDAKTPKTYKGSQVQVSEKKKTKGKKEEKVAASIGKKRKHVSDTDSEPDVEPDVPDISTTAKKRVKGKRIPLNIPDAPMDNVSFHYVEFAQRWNFFFHRRIAVERELSEEALSYNEIIKILEQAGLMKTVTGPDVVTEEEHDLDRVANTLTGKLVKKWRKKGLLPYGKLTAKSPDVVIEEEHDLDRVANTLTGKLVKKWRKKGLLPYGKLTAKYVVLYKIGTANWMATQHLSRVTPPLARILYLIGTGGKFDFRNLVYEQTLKHAGSFAVKLPILVPCLLSGLILHQHPNILRADEPIGKKHLPLKFDYRLFAGTHVPDIMLFAAKETASASGTKAPGSSKEDIVAELQEISKTLQDTIQDCKVRKLNVALNEVHAPAEEEAVEEEAEVVGNENVVVEEEKAQYETAEEEEENSDEEEDVTGSTSSGTASASL